MQVDWTQNALSDLASIYNHIAGDSPRYALAGELEWSAASHDMKSDTFKTKSKRLGVVYFITFFGISIPLLLIGCYGAHWVSTKFQLDRTAVFLFATPLFLCSFILGGCALQAVDRRYGLRCPHCGRSLTIRQHPAKIIAQGTCPNCREPIFDAA